MADIISLQELADAKLDAQSLERFINGGVDEEVLTRLSQQYPTMQNFLFQFQKHNSRSYKTYALMDADKTNIPAKSKVTVTNDATESNNGDWQWDGVAFTKSSFDPVEQAKGYADTTKAPLENFNADGNPDHLVEIKDKNGKLIASWNLNAELLTKFLTDGRLQSIENANGEKVLSLGNGTEVDIYGARFTLDLSNPDNAFQILSSDNKVLFSVPLGGIDADALSSLPQQVTNLSSALNVELRSDGISKAEIYQNDRLSETRRKIATLISGANEQFVITSIGNSWADTASYFTQSFVQAMKIKHGNAGAGFAAPDRGFADPSEAILVKSGTWVNTNGATTDGVNAEGLAIIKTTSTTANDYIQAQLEVGTATKAKLYAKANGAVIEVSGSGVTTQQITLSNTVNEFTCNLDVANSGTQYIRFKLISGEFSVFGIELQNTDKGIRFNKCGAGSSRWTRWLATDTTIWKEQLTALGSDLIIMIEGVNGSFAYNGTAEASYTDQIINRVREATKNTDILLLSPPEILMAHPYPLADFQYALRGKAKDWKVCHVDLQRTFGESLSEYDDSGRGYILASNPNHPSQKGAALIAGTLLKIING